MVERSRRAHLFILTTFGQLSCAKCLRKRIIGLEGDGKSRHESMMALDVRWRTKPAKRICTAGPAAPWAPLASRELR